MIKKLYLFLTLLTAFLWLGSGTAWGETLTVMDDDYYYRYVPVDGYSLDGVQHNQLLLLASEISAMNGSNITGMKFYFDKTGHSWSSSSVPNVTFKLKEVANTSISSLVTVDASFTTVYSGSINFSFTDKEWSITFSEPFTYNGGNLLIDIQTVAYGAYVKKSGSSYMRFYTKQITGRAVTNTTARDNFPKTTFTYEAASTGGCAKPKNLTKGAVTATSATFNWTKGADEASWQWVCLPEASSVDWSSPAVQTATSTTVTATGLSAETSYKFYVRADCGSEQSTEVFKAFTTPCVATSLPFEQNFDAEAANTIPACWSKFAYVSGDYSYPFVYSGGVTGNCMYSTGGGATTPSTIILPPLAEPTNTLLLSFSYKNYSTSTSYGQAKIGYVTDPNDASTFVSLSALTRKTGWTEVKKFALTGAPANSFIAIQLSGGLSGYNSQRLYLDDIKVSLPSSCTDPTGVSATATSTTTASVSWTEAGSATSWNIQYSTDNFSTHTDIDGVTANPYALTGLSGNTAYKVRVQADCGSEQSDWVVSSEFKTPCEPTTGIGFTQNFNSESHTAGSIPGCWQKINSGNYPYVYNYYARGGSGKCLYFYGGTSTSTQIAILPPFSENTSSLSISLYYNNASDWDDYSGANYGQMSIGYITDPTDASTFTALATLAKVNTYTLAKVPMIGAPDNAYIAIRYAGGTSTGGAFVDDIEISEVSSCLEPSSVAGVASTPNTASISWTENGSATAWKIRYSSDAGANWSGEISANANPFELTGLTGSSNYIVQVKAVCGPEEFSDWSVSSPSFPTPCDAIASMTDFSFEASEGCSVGGAMPNCWTRLPSAGTYPNIYNYYSKAGSNSLRFYGSAAQYAVLPPFSQEVKSLSISFWYRNYYSGVLEVGSMTDPEDASTFKSLATETTISDYGSSITKVNLSGADDGAYYIAFKHTGTNSYDGTYVDLVSVYTTPSCVEPTGVSASDETATSAVISWTAGGSESAWKLQYSTDGSNWTDANGGANVSNPFTLTGLTPNHTTYYARVKAVCSVSDESPWSAASDPFETDCAVASLPFNDDFSGADLGCWTKEHCYSSTGLYNGTFRFFYNNTWASEVPPQYLISPEIDAEGKQVTIEFDYYMYSGTETFKVGYSTTTKEVSAFTWGAEQTATNTTALKYSENLPAGVKYVAIMHTSDDQYYLYIDNFSVTEYVAPACPAVSAATLEESNVTAHTATVSWTAGGEETAWNLQYKAAGGEWSSVIPVATTPSYDLTGLAENTLYYVRVQADCAGDGTGDWTGDEAFSFPTDCEPKAVSKASPWNYDFEDTNDGFMPSCWERTEPYANYGYPIVAEYSYYAQSGDKYLYLRTPGRSGSSYTEDAILPVFNTEIKNLKVSFSYFNGAATSNYGQLAIGYVVGNEFTQVGDLLAQEDDYTSVEREMPNDAPDGARIAIRCIGSTKGSTYTTTVYVDDIQVSLKPTCYVPTALAAAETSDGAVLTWTAGKDENEWSVRYSVKDADEWTVVDDEITATNYTLTGLSQNVTYEVQVKAVCGVGDESAWSASAEFTPVCNAPTALAVTARTQNSASFSWTSSESAWVLQYSVDGENWESANVNANPFTLNGLSAGTTYQAKIQAACGSAFSNVVEFTTWCDSKLSLPVNLTSFTAIPACWEESPAGAISFNNSKLCFVGEGERFLYLPQTDVNLNLLSATFTFSGSLEFGYIDAPNGAFHAFEAQPTSGVELDLATIAPEAPKYIAIRYNGASNLSQASISAISIRKTPSCLAPTGVDATPSVGGAEISWTAGGSETAWNIQYKLASVASWDGAAQVAVSENPFEISGLEQGVSYKVRVQAACEDEDPSDWSEEASFTTDCAGIAELPWFADFSHDLSNCWTIHAESSSSYYIPAANTAMNQLKMDGGKEGNSNNVVVLPAISADLSNAVLSLEYKNGATGASYAKLEIGYVTDKNDASTFVLIGEACEQSTSFTEARVALADVTSGRQIAFRFAGATTQSDMTIKNLRVLEQFTLADNANNSAILASHNGKAVDVTIGRTIVRKGYYNTICLPFSLSAEEFAASPIASNDLWAFKYAKVDEATDELLFRIIEADHIEAGVPYFIGFENNEEDIVNPLFKNVTVSATAGQNVGNEVAQLCGIVDQPVVFEPNDQTKLFLAANNTLYWWAGDHNSQLNNFRAYFKVQTSAPGAPARHGMPARLIKQDQEEQIATGINNTNVENVTFKFIENDQVVIIRNGVKYNIQGQVISK